MYHWTHGLARLGELRVCTFEMGETARVFLVSKMYIGREPWRPPSTQSCIARHMIPLPTFLIYARDLAQVIDLYYLRHRKASISY
jgi:hypothetical protein